MPQPRTGTRKARWRPAEQDGADPAPQPPRAAPRRRDDRGERAERGLRGLVGSGPSQVGVSGALRARDAARPTAADLSAAEEELVVVRRHYVPPDRLAGTDPPGRGAGRPAHTGGSAPEDS